MTRDLQAESYDRRYEYAPDESAERYLRREDLESNRRRVKLPLILFVVTCFSTFWVGITNWVPTLLLTTDIRMQVVAHWQQGLIYTGAVLAILLTHEMGHFIATLIHRIPASLPFFIPWPVGSFGTMGAVIGMAGHRANRRELFDIGIAGPLAGLVVAIPILYLGVKQLDLSQAGIGPYQLDLPVVVRMMISSVRPDLKYVESIALSQLNPYFMAAWVGLLVTGLNMMPISQLDGGHVIYALLLRKGHFVARLFLLAAITYVLISGTLMWIVMILLVTLIGTDHPPTANDNVPLGWFRTLLGVVSLSIPFLCFPPRGLLM